MSEDELKSLPMVGSQVITACGTKEKFIKTTPRAFHEGKWYYFCTPACQEDFIRDPENSCLTSHITTGEE
jgi:YHS domain-containing protein